MDTSTLTELWQRTAGVQPESPTWLVVVSGVAALITVMHSPTWRITRNVVTIAHEGGHALAALVTGRKLRGIRLHSDTSGVTLSKGKPRGAGMVITGVAGYVTPSLLGLGAAGLIAAGHITAVLWTVIVALAAMLLLIRNFYGLVSVLVTGAGVFLVSWLAPALAQTALAYLITWFLLLAGTRPIAELQGKRRRGRARSSDPDQLARITPVPGTAWVALFAVTAVAALLMGVAGLLPPIPLPLP